MRAAGLCDNERERELLRRARSAVAHSLELRYVELPAATKHEIKAPVDVDVVPGDEAAGRIPDPTVRSELTF